MKCRSETGAASVFQVGVVAGLVAVALLLVGLVQVRTQMLLGQVYADAAALAGAEALKTNFGMVGAELEACKQAQVNAVTNGVELESCVAQGGGIWVCVGNSVTGLEGGFMREKCAHAGGIGKSLDLVMSATKP